MDTRGLRNDGGGVDGHGLHHRTGQRREQARLDGVHDHVFGMPLHGHGESRPGKHEAFDHTVFGIARSDDDAVSRAIDGLVMAGIDGHIVRAEQFRHGAFGDHPMNRRAAGLLLMPRGIRQMLDERTSARNVEKLEGMSRISAERSNSIS